MKTIGIIGLGSIGERHAQNLQDMGHNWVFHDPAKDAGFRIERLFADDVDAVVVASPTPQHFDDLWRCFHHKKPTFVEKPIADRLGAPLEYVNMVGYNLRFHGCVKKAKEWLDAGLIGKPIWANFILGQYSEKPPYLRDGVILNWSHEIDLATYLLGNAKVTASSTRTVRPGTANSDVNVYLVSDGDDITDILLTHKGGCRSTVHLDYVTKPEVRQFIIGGTTGTIEVYLLSRTAYLNSSGIIAESAFRGRDTWNDNYIEEMQAFLDRIDGKETIGCTGEEGLEVLKICLEVRKQAGLS